jgi:hypothetical protein
MRQISPKLKYIFFLFFPLKVQQITNFYNLNSIQICSILPVYIHFRGFILIMVLFFNYTTLHHALIAICYHFNLLLLRDFENILLAGYLSLLFVDQKIALKNGFHLIFPFSSINQLTVCCSHIFC